MFKSTITKTQITCEQCDSPTSYPNAIRFVRFSRLRNRARKRRDMREAGLFQVGILSPIIRVNSWKKLIRDS